MRYLISLFALIILVTGYFLLKPDGQTKPQETNELLEVQPPEKNGEDEVLLLGDHMLAEHGLSRTPAAYDVRLLHDFIETANLENRHIDTYFFSTNPDLTEILLGKEGMSRPQLSANQPVIGKNQYGETVLIDRWKTPYRVHLVERNLIEIFSAGPDQKMGTSDDLRWPPPK